MHLDALLEEPLDDRVKGVPGGTRGLPLGEVGGRGWNLLRGDLPLPSLVLKEGALAHNGAWMRRFLATTGAKIAPHGKTTMSPQLFQRQLDDGAWAITLATAHQVQVARRYGVPRILLANQLLGREETRAILDELRRDPDFDFYCLVDSPEGAADLADAVRAAPFGRPLQVLLEGGFAGGRTGARNLAAALATARAVKATPHLALRGVEGFEGIVAGADGSDTERRIGQFLDFLVAIAGACAAEFAPGPAILSAGGSAYFDLVAERFGRAGLDREVMTVLRCGCYFSHDSVMYREAFRRMLERSPRAAELGEGLKPALELWARVQSRPEPTRAILSFGKRDASYDAGLPVPLLRFRPGTMTAPEPVPDGHRVVAINDQHAFLDLPAASPFAVGDLVACGISHPCLAFDKWQFIPVVDDDYRVTSAIRTFF